MLEDLGFDRVKVYDAAWLDYAARLDAPAEQQTLINVGLLLGQLRALAGRLEQFERRFGAQMPVTEHR